MSVHINGGNFDPAGMIPQELIVVSCKDISLMTVIVLFLRMANVVYQNVNTRTNIKNVGIILLLFVIKSAKMIKVKNVKHALIHNMKLV